MKSAVKTIQWGLAAALAVGLLAGCSSPAPRNQKVYDRYAELIAQRSRATDFKAESSAQPIATAAATPKPIAKAAAPADRTPVRAVPAEKPAPAQPASAAQPAELAKPAPVKVMAPPAAEPAAKPAAVAPSAPASPASAVVLPPPPESQTPESETAPSPDGVAYLLKPGDVVQIYLRGIPSAEVIEGSVDENGMVSLPFINEVMAAGRTASELSRNIRSVYLERGIYQNISVNVVVPTRYYFIQGEIRSPGRFQIVTAMRVSQAIAAAGGYTEFASGQVLVKRGGKIVKTIRNSRRLERTPEDDILLEPDDIIEVNRSLW